MSEQLHLFDEPIFIPRLDQQVQENYLIPIWMKDRITGERVLANSTPLRWLYDNLARIVYVETLTKGYAETASDSEASCPVCLENYKKPGEETVMAGAERASQQTEKPLKIGCGHIIGINCLREIVNLKYKGTPRCPLCRRRIDTWPDFKKLESIRKGDSEELVCLLMWGLVCLLIKRYIIGNPNKPETHDGLIGWMQTSRRDTGYTAVDEKLRTWLIRKVEEWEKVAVDEG